MNNHITLTAALALAIALTSCASIKYIPVETEKPPNISQRYDITKIKRIAVMPFEFTYNPCSELSMYATSELAKIISEEGFTLVDTLEVKRLQASGQSLENYVDAIFLGKITDCSQTTVTHYYGGDSRDGNVYRNLGELEHDYMRRKEKHSSYTTADVTVGYSYSFMITKDGSFFGPFSGNITKSGRNSDRAYKYAITAMLGRIRNDIAPYKNTTSYSIQKKAWDKAMDKEMDKAFSHFNKGECDYNGYCDAKFSQKDYKLALEAYLGIYERHKNIYAGLNASYLYHALGDTKSALNFIKKAYAETGGCTSSNCARDVTDLYHALGDTESALRVVKKHYEEDGWTFFAEKVAKYYNALGDTESALRVLQEAYEKDKGNNKLKAEIDAYTEMNKLKAEAE